MKYQKRIERRARWLARLPKFVVDTPFEWLISLMAFLSGLTNVLGIAEASIVFREFPGWVVFIWGLCLMLGGGSLFLGLSFQWAEVARQGYGLLALSSGVFCALIVVLVGIPDQVLLTVFIYLVFCIVCCVRRAQLTLVKRVSEAAVRRRRENL